MNWISAESTISRAQFTVMNRPICSVKELIVWKTFFSSPLSITVFPFMKSWRRLCSCWSCGSAFQVVSLSLTDVRFIYSWDCDDDENICGSFWLGLSMNELLQLAKSFINILQLIYHFQLCSQLKSQHIVAQNKAFDTPELLNEDRKCYAMKSYARLTFIAEIILLLNTDETTNVSAGKFENKNVKVS